MEDVELESKYKSYTTQVEKVLKQFESPREWADLCAYLTKLKRILQNNAKYHLIPKKLLVAKRLSQCLHHALPSGVHLKTLEVYVLIFKRIGAERLSKDLAIYSMGLFPLMGHSAMSVRPKLLDIFDTYFLPLGANLIPCLHGFILSLLSGLEEGSEHFDSITALLGKLKNVTDRTLFYGSLWRALISSPSVRFQGSLYVLTQITKRRRIGTAVLGDDRETLITALSLGLQDSNVLTQRNFLDFILFACPLNSKDFARQDILRLLRSALCVLLRRDMSLNRRVYNWLEGHGAHESNESKRISMTSQELQSIVDDVSRVSGDEADERYGTPSDVTPRPKRKNDRGMSEASHVSVPNGSPYENITIPPADKFGLEAPPPADMRTIQEEEEKQRTGSASTRTGSASTRTGSASTRSPSSRSVTPVPGGRPEEDLSESTREGEEEIDFGEPVFNFDLGSPVSKESTDLSSPVSKESTTVSKESTDPSTPDIEERKPPQRQESENDTTMTQEKIDAIRAQFFQQYGRPCMMLCLRELLYVESTDKTVLMQPYRIINSLMDRQDFGSAIIEDILIDINRALYKNCVLNGITITATCTTQLKLHTSNIAKELIKAANMLINTFEPHLLWDWLSTLLTTTVSEDEADKGTNNKIFQASPCPSFDELLSITDFLLEIVSVEYNASVQSSYLPLVLQSICEYLCTHVMELESSVLAHAIETSSNLLSRAQPSTIVAAAPAQTTPEPNSQSDKTLGAVTSTEEGTRTGDIEMDEISAIYDLESEEESHPSAPALPAQDYVSKAITKYQEFLSALIQHRILATYRTATVNSSDVAAMFLPACRLLLDYACFPIFCNMNNEHHVTAAQPLLLTDSTWSKSDEKVLLPGWLLSLLECSQLSDWEDVVLSAVKTLSVLIGLTLSIAEEQGAGRKTIEGSTVVVLMPMLSELELHFIQSKTGYFSDIIRSLWGYLGAQYAHLHYRVVKLLWKLHHLAPSPDIAENVMGEMLSSSLLSDRLEGLRRFTVFWHISAKLSDNCKEWSKLQVSGKDLSRTTLALLECLQGPDYQSRLLAKAWISQCFHYGDINRILDPLLIQLQHPSSARTLHNPQQDVVQSAVESSEHGTSLSVSNLSSSATDPSEDDAHSLNYRTKLSVLTEDSKSETSAEYSTAESGEDHTVDSSEMSKPDEGRKRTDCQNELFYNQEYDTNRSKYIWHIMLAMLQADPVPFVRSCHNAKFNATSKYLSQEVYELFHKHRMLIRNELFADPFFMTLSERDPNVESKMSVADRLRKISKSYLELLVTVCLWYTRSRYDRNGICRTVFDSNCEVRLVAVEFLSSLVRRCIDLPTELRKTITDTLFDRCHLQESILHVFQRSIVAHTEAAYIVREDLDVLEWTKSFLSEILVLLQNILELEKCVGWGEWSKTSNTLKDFEFDYKYVNYCMNSQDTHITKVNLVNTDEETSNSPKYVPNLPVIGQPLFIHCVLVALTTRRLTFAHKNLVDTVHSCLEYKSPLLRKLSEVTVQQLLHNIHQLSKEYNHVREPNPVVGCVPVNQVVLLLESLTTVVHFILVHAPLVHSSNSNNTKSGIFDFFSFHNDDSSSSYDADLKFVSEAKGHMLQYIPKCFDTLVDVWMNWKMADSETSESVFPWGQPHDVKNLVLNFASPMFKKYPASMLSSLCEVWHLNRRNLIFGRPGHLVSAPSKKQLAIIDFMMEINVCTFDVVLKNSQKLLNTAISHQKDSREQFGFQFEVELVHLTYEYFRHLKKPTIQKAWPHLLNLLRESASINTSPPITLLSLGFLQLYLTHCPQFDDLKARRELQDITSKLLELTTEIASKSLSSNTWFGRKSEVLPVYNEVISIKKEAEDTEDSLSDDETYEGEHVYTLQAIYVLNECLAQIIDLVYGSEEKDKAIAILSPLISKISVYIRNHAHHNMPNAKASAALLASITDYQYCRKAWSKELFDTLMDPEFFIIDPTSLPHWKIIVEHLIASDNLLFTDLLTRVTTATGGLLSSNDVFYQQKARLLRRLTFTLYCCEYNQYSKYISKIQECFVESLKLTQAPQVIREVFLGFRVVILRMSPATFTPLWPIMLNELYGNLVEFRDLLRKQGNKGEPPINTKYLNMYLSISKLLDLALILPAQVIPDFQVHNWSFVCDRPANPDSDAAFNCLAAEIAQEFHSEILKDYDIIRAANTPFLTMSHIAEAKQLQPFYTSLARNGLFGTEGNTSEETSTKLIEKYLDQEYLDLH